MKLRSIIDPGTVPRCGRYRVAKVLVGLSLDGKGKASFSLSSRVSDVFSGH